MEHPATLDPFHLVRQRSRGCVFKQKTEEETRIQQITGSEHVIIFALNFYGTGLRRRKQSLECYICSLLKFLQELQVISTQVQNQKPKSWCQISVFNLQVHNKFGEFQGKNN